MAINWTGSSVVDSYSTISTYEGDIISLNISSKSIDRATSSLSVLPIQPTLGRPTSGQLYPRYVPGA